MRSLVFNIHVNYVLAEKFVTYFYFFSLYFCLSSLGKKFSLISLPFAVDVMKFVEF